jgi:hypothetical protein
LAIKLIQPGAAVFGRVKNWVRDVRIGWDFLGYENECRLEHERKADRRFSTLELDKELEELLKKIQADADKLFGKVIAEISAREQQIQSSVYSKETMLALFLRNYKEELDILHKEKASLILDQVQSKKIISEIYNELADAKKLKDEAYVNLNYYKDAVESWYAKSERTPWLGGNKGKKLPNHAIFGQSHGDLDSYKYHRDKAYEDTQDCLNNIKSIKEKIHIHKNNLADINGKIERIFQKIRAVQEVRNRMFELKKEGYSKVKLQSEISELRQVLNQEQQELSKQIANRIYYITASKHQRGFMALENIIKTVQKNKDDFISEFSLPENQIKRKNQHRILWLKQRNISCENG